MRTALTILMLVALMVPALAIDAPNLVVTETKYDPYPAEPGKYVTIWFKVENVANSKAENVEFELIPEYPFSVDPGYETTKKITSLNGHEDVLIEYKLRVDANAVRGDNEIKLSYKACSFCNWITKSFNIYVAKSTNEPDLELILSEVTPKAFPTGTSKIVIDVVNVAPGTAYYVLAEPVSDYASIMPNKIYVGNLEADDYDSIEFEATFKEIEPGTYPINIKLTYKDSEFDKVEKTQTVNVNVVSKKEGLEPGEVPLEIYFVYVIAAVLVIWFWRRKGWFPFRKQVESV